MLTLRAQVNPEIRGGLIVEIGDRTIDLSVSSKIAKMNKLLQDSLYIWSDVAIESGVVAS